MRVENCHIIPTHGLPQHWSPSTSSFLGSYYPPHSKAVQHLCLPVRFNAIVRNVRVKKLIEVEREDKGEVAKGKYFLWPTLTLALSPKSFSNSNFLLVSIETDTYIHTYTHR